MGAKRKPEPTPTRYYVEWHPTAEVEAECVKLGMRPDDGSSFWDWVEIFEHRKTKTFHGFDEAVAFALAVAGDDCFGGARIYRQEQVVAKDDRGRSFIRWDDECFWDGVNANWPKPDASSPDEWIL